MVCDKVYPDTDTSLMHEVTAHPPSPPNETYAGPLPVSHDSEVVVRTMEAEYIDMTGGFISPLNDSIEVSLVSPSQEPLSSFSIDSTDKL